MGARTEHMAWMKERALEFANAGDLDNALASLATDITKHPETKTQTMRDVIRLGHELRFSGLMSTQDQVIEWIEGLP